MQLGRERSGTEADAPTETAVLAAYWRFFSTLLELALRLFRDDSLMAKREARRRKYFVAPSARRKIKSIAARKRATRNRR